ncbi:hypothetical protein B0H14DRAFT_2583117 [Mycena olivaceomarginata]|nr:hypothetical protein B0H14DRAFT_2583117 [Mycena olivaceomarginata]
MSQFSLCISAPSRPKQPTASRITGEFLGAKRISSHRTREQTPKFKAFSTFNSAGSERTVFVTRTLPKNLLHGTGSEALVSTCLVDLAVTDRATLVLLREKSSDARGDFDVDLFDSGSSLHVLPPRLWYLVSTVRIRRNISQPHAVAYLQPQLDIPAIDKFWCYFEKSSEVQVYAKQGADSFNQTSLARQKIFEVQDPKEALEDDSMRSAISCVKLKGKSIIVSITVTGSAVLTRLDRCAVVSFWLVLSLHDNMGQKKSGWCLGNLFNLVLDDADILRLRNESRARADQAYNSDENVWPR